MQNERYNARNYSFKNENRSIGQRMKTLGDKVTKLTLHIAKATTNNKGNFRKRNSYCNLIRILEDSQIKWRLPQR